MAQMTIGSLRERNARREGTGVPYPSPMSLSFATQLTAIATVVLAAFAIITAVVAAFAFEKQSDAVRAGC